MSKLKTYTISQLAREFGVTPRALRFYEDKDLLHPARDGMNRVYSYRDRARLILILRGKRLGLSLADIRDILDLYGIENSELEQVKLLREKFKKQITEFEDKRDDIERALAELKEGLSKINEALGDEPAIAVAAE